MGWIQVKNHRLRRTQTSPALWNRGCEKSFRRQYKTELERRLIILKNGLEKTCYNAGNCWFSASRRTTDENLSRFFRKQFSSSILVFHEYCWCQKKLFDLSSLLCWLVASDRIDFKNIKKSEWKISFILLVFLACLVASDMAQLEQE